MHYFVVKTWQEDTKFPAYNVKRSRHHMLSLRYTYILVQVCRKYNCSWAFPRSNSAMLPLVRPVSNRDSEVSPNQHIRRDKSFNLFLIIIYVFSTSMRSLKNGFQICCSPVCLNFQVYWIQLADHRVQWRAFLNSNELLDSINDR
jgi:hypothetical protein